MQYEILHELNSTRFWAVMVRWTDRAGNSLDVRVPLPRGADEETKQRLIAASKPDKIPAVVAEVDPRRYTQEEWLALHPVEEPDLIDRELGDDPEE